MGPIFWLSLRQMGGRWRLLIILLLAAMPIALAVVVSYFQVEDEGYDEGFVNVLLDGLIVGGSLPIVTMVLATSAFANELEDRTLSYLVLKPVRRSVIVLPKMLAAIVIAGPLLVVSGVVATVVGYDSDPQTVAAVVASLLAGVVTYAAIFTWAGLISSHALGFGLVYVFLWEGFIGTFLGGVRYLSVRGYALAIMHGIDGSAFEALDNRVIEFPAAVAGATAVTVAFFLLAVRRLRRMDVP